MAVNTVVAILIAVSEASSPTTAAMTGAVTEALGPETSLVLRTTAAPSDAEVIAIERELRADAVARVVWDGPEQTSGVLRAHLRWIDRWFERRVTFSGEDSRVERGRTLGFAFASVMLFDRESRHEAGPAPAMVSAPSEPYRPALAAGSAGPPTLNVSAVAVPAANPRGRGLTLELAAQAVTGIGGAARSLGAALHAELPMRGAFCARAGAALRAGPVQGLDGEETIAGFGAGLAFRPYVPAPGSGALGLGVTLEALGLYQDLSHHAASGTVLHQGHLIGGLAAGLDGAWAAGRALDLFLGLGAEVAFGTTDVSVAGLEVATVPPVRLTAQAGLRWHF